MRAARWAVCGSLALDCWGDVYLERRGADGEDHQVVTVGRVDGRAEVPADQVDALEWLRAEWRAAASDRVELAEREAHYAAGRLPQVCAGYR